jgi:hypothetical protein
MVATLLTLASASVASAGTGIHVSGTYLGGNASAGITVCQPVGQNGFIFNCTTTGFVSQFFGDLVGSSVSNFTQQVNCKTGRAHGNGDETFTGSVTGVGSGTLTWRDVFDANFDCNTFFESGFSIRSVSVSGSGGFAGLQGKLMFTDTTYDGELH